MDNNDINIISSIYEECEILKKIKIINDFKMFYNDENKVLDIKIMPIKTIDYIEINFYNFT